MRHAVKTAVPANETFALFSLIFSRRRFVDCTRFGVGGGSIRRFVSGFVVSVVVFPVLLTVSVVSISPLDLEEQTKQDLRLRLFNL